MDNSKNFDESYTEEESNGSKKRRTNARHYKDYANSTFDCPSTKKVCFFLLI